MTRMEMLLRIGERLGVPTMLCLIIFFAIYLSISWTVKHVAEPVVKKHIEFLDTEQSSMRTIADNSGLQSKSVGAIAESLTDQKDLIGTVIDNQKVIVKSQKDISSALNNSSKSEDRRTKLLEQIRDDQRKFPAVSERMP